jgi:hypothetical protein
MEGSKAPSEVGSEPSGIKVIVVGAGMSYHVVLGNNF